MSEEKAKKRPTKKGLQINMGLLSMVVDVLSPRVPNAAKDKTLHMLCPEWESHSDKPHGVKQRYVCEETLSAEDGLWEPAELNGLRYREVDDVPVVVSGDEVDTIKEEASFPTLEVRAHPHDDTQVLAAGNVYIVQPSAPSQFYSTLLPIIGTDGVIETESGPKMLVGEVTLKKGSTLFVRLERWNGQLVIRELIRPEDVDSFDLVDSTADTRQVDLARQLIEATSEEFNPDVYRSKTADALKELLDARAASGEMPSGQVVKPTKAPEDITALLEAALAMAKES